MPLLKSNSHTIISNFNEKFISKIPKYHPNMVIKSKWVPGINLLTFKMCNGIYPEKITIKNAIQNLQNIKSNDWMPNNMVIQGKKIELIDRDDPNGKINFNKKRFNNILKLIDIDSPEKVKDFFWKSIVRNKQRQI